MHDEAHMLIVKKKRRFCIPKNLNISHCWNIIESTVAQEIGALDYTPIPNYFDTNAYKIGYIFVPTSTQVTDNNNNFWHLYTLSYLFITYKTDKMFPLRVSFENTRTNPRFCGGKRDKHQVA